MGTNEKNNVVCYGYDDDENNIWLCASDKNALCRVDKKTKTGNVIGTFPDFCVNSKQMSWAIKCIARKVVFSPFGGDHILVYDNESNNVASFKIAEPKNECGIRYIESQKFIAIVPYKHYCFLIGRTYPGIIRFDLETGEMMLIDAFVKELVSRNIINNAFFSDGYIMKENCIFLGVACNNNLFRFNLDTFEYAIIAIDCCFKGIGGICSQDDTIWLTDFSKIGNEIINYDIITNSYVTISMPITDRLLAPVISGQNLFLFPLTDKHKMISYNYINKQWNLHELFNENAGNKSGRIIIGRSYGDCIVGAFEYSKRWFRFRDGSYDYFYYTVNTEELDMRQFKESKGSYISEADLTLERFILFL